MIWAIRNRRLTGHVTKTASQLVSLSSIAVFWHMGFNMLTSQHASLSDSNNACVIC